MVRFSVFSSARKLFNRISYSALACAMVFWLLLSPLLTAKLGPFGNWFEISKTLAVCSNTSVIFFSNLES